MNTAGFGLTALAAASFGLSSPAVLAESLSTPTHKEIAPIKIPLGEEGAIKTIAMDSQGNLLVGVSWKAGASGTVAPDLSASVNVAMPRRESATPADSGKTLACLREAIQKGTPEGWDKLLKEVSPEDFRAAMMNAGIDIRREIMPRLPEDVRVKLMQRMGGPEGPRNPRDMYPGSRGGISPELSTDQEGHTYALDVVSPDGKVLSTWPMTDGLQPKMIFGCDDGMVYAAGGGRLAQFSADGKRVRMVDTDKIYRQPAAASGLYTDEQHVFIAFGMGNSTRATEDIYRFKRDLTEPNRIIERQFGCCSHIDLKAVNGELLVAENSRHRVNRFDLEGKQLGTWGRRDRERLEGFAACCNPCNFDLGPGGVLYTAESGVGRVKKYTPDGKFLGLVGYVDTAKYDAGSQYAATSCYIPIEVNQDASRIYVMDLRASIIRVLAKTN